MGNFRIGNIVGFTGIIVLRMFRILLRWIYCVLCELEEYEKYCGQNLLSSNNQGIILKLFFPDE